jgi:catechol 2,3-dioxygenase-like lactoylglutathione lyase family enzyme
VTIWGASGAAKHNCATKWSEASHLTEGDLTEKGSGPPLPIRMKGKTVSNPAFKFDHIHIISENPRASADWYVEMFGATIAADKVARGAPQIFVDLGGMTILVRGRRPGETPVPARPIRSYGDFSSHNAWGTDHFGFLYQGDLAAFCDKLRAKGATFPVELKKGVNGSLLCYVAAPDGVSVELMQC